LSGRNASISFIVVFSNWFFRDFYPGIFVLEIDEVVICSGNISGFFAWFTVAWRLKGRLRVTRVGENSRRMENWIVFGPRCRGLREEKGVRKAGFYSCSRKDLTGIFERSHKSDFSPIRIFRMLDFDEIGSSNVETMNKHLKDYLRIVYSEQENKKSNLSSLALHYSWIFQMLVIIFHFETINHL
jgi:hypothetical protein